MWVFIGCQLLRNLLPGGTKVPSPLNKITIHNSLRGNAVCFFVTRHHGSTGKVKKTPWIPDQPPLQACYPSPLQIGILSVKHGKVEMTGSASLPSCWLLVCLSKNIKANGWSLSAQAHNPRTSHRQKQKMIDILSLCFGFPWHDGEFSNTR